MARPRFLAVAGFLCAGALSAAVLFGQPTQPVERPTVGPGGGLGSIPAIPSMTEPADPWTDARFLDCQLGWACTAVEAVVGARFSRRPKVLSSTRAEVAHAIVRRERTIGGASPAEPSVEDVDRWSVEHRHWLDALIGNYDDSLHVIHVVPQGIKDLISWSRSECSTPSVDILRLVLVHEATHALDTERHPGLGGTTDGDERIRMRNFVREGDAFHVTREVAVRTGLLAAHDELMAIVLSVECGGDPYAREREMASNPFWDEDGSRLFIEEAQILGGRPLVESILEAPPGARAELNPQQPWLKRRLGLLPGP